PAPPPGHPPAPRLAHLPPKAQTQAHA
ncbi:hypothetical protein A2U01_0102811, partial [Trifolium medium]|nr:hypothetical protein [Trifolium medium]